MEKKREKFNRILRDIKSIKIQGAVNIAKAALKAYFLFPTKASKEKLLSSKPTEPMMQNVLSLAYHLPYTRIISHFKISQDKINKYVFNIIKSGDVIFTHCHSSNVVRAIIYSKKHKKKLEVYNTETRPLYQGRKTAKELRKASVKVTMFTEIGRAHV